MKKEACKAFVDFASASYSEIAGQLDEAVRSFKGKYLYQQKIAKLKDVCPDVRLPKPTLSNFYPENVAETFVRLTSCRQRLANAIFSDSPAPLTSQVAIPPSSPSLIPLVVQVATPQCLKIELKIELKELKDSYKSDRFQLPVEGVNRGCFEVTLPFQEGKDRMFEVRVPSGYKVSFLPNGHNFIPRTMEGEFRLHRRIVTGDSGKSSKTFLIFVSKENGGTESTEIPVIFSSRNLVEFD